MRRHAPPRLLGLLLAVWFVLVGGEQAAIELCPMHGNLAMVAGHRTSIGGGSEREMSTAPHGSAHATASHQAGEPTPQSHHEHGGCGCGGCCAAGLVIADVPRPTEVAVPTEVVVAVAAASRVASRPRAPPPHALPFPTGPPRA